MPTMAQALRAFVEATDGPVTSEQVKNHIRLTYPDTWKPSTLQAHLYGCVVNNPKAYVHHSSTEKFLYRNSDDTFSLYSEVLHGPNEWAPVPGSDEEPGFEEFAETTISLERDIEDHLVSNLEVLERGLILIGRQVSTEVGRVDILAEDASGHRVVIEVKVGEARDPAIGQIARYLGWYSRKDGQATRGLLVAASFPEGVQYAASAIPRLELIAYRVRFSFDRVSV